MTIKIQLKSTRMSLSIMQMLEEKKKIIRLCPNHHELNPKDNSCLNKCLYASDKKYGPHMVIAVTVNWFEPLAFGTHDENEEFILVGGPHIKPMWLIIAMCSEEDLKKKITNKSLVSDDFIAVLVKYNDPEVSFFTMLKHVPHGEVTTSGSEKPPSFYVTESKNNTLNKTEFGEYQLVIEQKKKLGVVL
ncbi:hypothetical protein MUO66_04655 [Candidatus Bathyarchaeota archaeon]|nr:hypothetical protein [Candidatus Bathyarchaeota archaeon]